MENLNEDELINIVKNYLIDNVLEDIKNQAFETFTKAIEDCKMYLKADLKDCETVASLLNNYKKAPDPISDFMKNNVILEKGTALTSIVSLYQAYVEYCSSIKEKPLKRKDFKVLIETNYNLIYKRKSNSRGYEVQLIK